MTSNRPHNPEHEPSRDTEMDEAIHRAMRSGAGEPPLLRQVTEAMAGPTWWLNLIGVPAMLGFFGLGVWSAIRFFDAPDTRDMIMWAVAFLFSAQVIAMLKIWYWMLMNRNAVTREVKRLEFQVARLVNTRDGI